MDTAFLASHFASYLVHPTCGAERLTYLLTRLVPSPPQLAMASSRASLQRSAKHKRKDAAEADTGLQWVSREEEAVVPDVASGANDLDVPKDTEDALEPHDGSQAASSHEDSSIGPSSIPFEEYSDSSEDEVGGSLNLSAFISSCMGLLVEQD